MKKLGLILITFILAACASSKPVTPVAASKPAPVAETPREAEPVVAAPAPEPAPPAPAPVAPEPIATPAPASVPMAAEAPAPAAIDPFDDPNNILAKRSVFYPFDISVVQPADKPIVAAHAQYLSEHANRRVRVEGNCDERGSSEYNLALGQRRADGVKKLLVAGGAADGQIEAVSFGEDKPRATGHDEDSWQQNRRSDLVYVK
ncbi:MAG: peptidoglycan-associated lipoprotein Pal [Pseudomonadota bacterium]